MLFTESLSPNRNPVPLAHSFGFSSLTVPQDNLITSSKANMVSDVPLPPKSRAAATTTPLLPVPSPESLQMRRPAGGEGGAADALTRCS